MNNVEATKEAREAEDRRRRLLAELKKAFAAEAADDQHGRVLVRRGKVWVRFTVRSDRVDFEIREAKPEAALEIAAAIMRTEGGETTAGEERRPAMWCCARCGVTDQPCDDPVRCPGKGVCHGPLAWCARCGNVAEVCDDPGCDAHAEVWDSPVPFELTEAGEAGEDAR